MPIYEYRCGSCGFEKEYLQKLSDAPISDCPRCGKPQMAKLLSVAGFQLKGTGWYATDFKNGPQRKPAEAAAKSDTANKPDAPKSEAPKSEAPKPDAPKSDKADASGKADAAPASGASPACQ